MIIIFMLLILFGLVLLLKNETYLNELIWRDFYQMIIYHFPHSVQGSFKKKYDNYKKKAEKAEKRLKFGTEGAAVRYSAFDGGTMSLNFNFKLSNEFIEKLDRRINRVQKALEDIRNDLRRSEDF